MKLRKWSGLLIVCVSVAMSMSADQIFVHDIPVQPNPGWHTSYATIMAPFAQVVSVTFYGSYQNAGTGTNAANAEFVLMLLSGGGTWRVRGSEMGWAGSGSFTSTVPATAMFNGPISGTNYWESLNSTPGGITTNAFFRVVILVHDITKNPPPYCCPN